MAELGSLLDTGDKVASIVGALVGVLALSVAIRAGARRRTRGPDARVAALLAAQVTDARRHRYRFFGEHVPALTDLYVRSRATLGGQKPRTVQATQILEAHRHAVLLGDAGAGKSTFLATVTADFAVQARSRGGRGDIAVIVPAADLVGRALPEALAVAVRRDLAVDLPADVFARAPAGGRVWRVLIDGLDEVIAAQDRSEVLWRVRGLLADPGPYRFLLTCRPLTTPELAELRGPLIGVYDLRSFDRRELDEFAHRWFTARFPDDRRRADRMASRFLARVAGARLGPVARVPLLATIAALVYESEDDRALPSSRAALYDRFVDHLLDGRRSLERFRVAIEPELPPTVAEWLFADIRKQVGGLLRACGAAWMTDADVRLTTVAAAWIEANAPRDLGPGRDRLVRDLLLTTGVCTLRRERVVFAHQSFAEYFAAAAGAFDHDSWTALAIDPAGRSLAGFMAARRADADTLVADLLARDEPNAAGDLLADGVVVPPATRTGIVEALVRQVAEETDRAPEALRILGELSVGADVLMMLSDLAADRHLSSWTRALVADRIADIDPAAGHELLREVAQEADPVVRGWIADTLADRGGYFDSDARVLLRADAVPTDRRPLNALARQALTSRLADERVADLERVEAARQLAEGGDLTPLRAMAGDVNLDWLTRVRLTEALADVGHPGPLREFAFTSGSPQTAYAAALALFERDDPSAVAALRHVVEVFPGRPMTFAAAARCAELGDVRPLTRIIQQPGEPHVRLAAARRLAALGNLDALRWLLKDPQAPALQAATLAGLLAVGQADAVPRLEELLRSHRFPTYKQVELRYLLAANGHAPSRAALHRLTGRRTGSSIAIEAAIALTALDDPQGRKRLRRTARTRRLRQRARMHAAVGLVQVDPDNGREVMEALAGPGSGPALRLRAGTVLLGLRGIAGPLARFAFDEEMPAAKRAEAIELLVEHDDADLRARLMSLARTGAAPPRVRVAAAPLLPDEEARAVLSSIAAGAVPAGARVAALLMLETADGPHARRLFGRLIRDGRVGRFRRWWLALTHAQLLPSADGEVIARRLGFPEGSLRWFRALAALVVERPERVLASRDG